jgi:hypothetical protein
MTRVPRSHMFDVAVFGRNFDFTITADMVLFLAQAVAHLLMTVCAHESMPALQPRLLSKAGRGIGIARDRSHRSPSTLSWLIRISA